ncbi:MAG: inositol 2-dehydrogenase [Methyloligellaceae bacterium]
MINIGLLGCGRIGQVHGKSVSRSSRARLVAVSDANRQAADGVAAETGAVVRSNEEVIADSDITGVIISTPTPTHCDLIETAFANGKAVLCEKPFDMSVTRIENCLETIKDTSLPLILGFNRRFDPSFAELQTRLADGEIGGIEMVSIISRDPQPPSIDYIKSSGGLFRDMMIHDFDMARFLLREEPVEVHAVGSSLVDPDIGAAGDVDTACVILKTASGKLCQISNSRQASYGYDQRIEVHGARGMLRAQNIHETTIEIADQFGFRSDPIQNFFLERYLPAYERELEHLLDCIETGANPSPDGHDGLRAQILADAADRSCKNGEIIKLDI